MKEIERFIAEARCGKRYTVSCLQEIIKNSGEESAPDVRHYRTSDGELLKAIDESTFHILGSDKVIKKNTMFKSLKFNKNKDQLYKGPKSQIEVSSLEVLELPS